MYNILYLSDKINFYSAKQQKLIKHVPLYDTLNNGLIVDIKKFYKSFKKLYKNHNIKAGLFYEKIIIITPPNFNNVYKYVYKEIFSNLNYKIILFKSEINFYKVAKNNVNINIGENYFFYSTNINGKLKSYVYNIKELNKIELKKEKIYYLYGKNNIEFINRLEQGNYSYYIYQDSDNYFINKTK